MSYAIERLLVMLGSYMHFIYIYAMYMCVLHVFVCVWLHVAQQLSKDQLAMNTKALEQSRASITESRRIAAGMVAIMFTLPTTYICIYLFRNYLIPSRSCIG